MSHYLESFYTPLLLLLPFTVILLLGFRDTKKNNKENKEGYLGALSLKTICGVYTVGFGIGIFVEIERAAFRVHHEISFLFLVLALAFDFFAYLILKKNRTRFSSLVFLGAFVGLSLVPVICSMLIYSQNNIFRSGLNQIDGETYDETMYIETNMFGQCTFSHRVIDDKDLANDIYKNQSDSCSYKVEDGKYLFTFDGNKEENPITCTIGENGIACPSQYSSLGVVSLQKSKPGE